MIRFVSKRNPVTLKRWRRFRARRRAFWSLNILAVLFAVSLASELLCNNRPLLVRCQGRWFVPVLRFYPEDAFLNNGRFTRPDYKALNRSPLFADRTGNFMVFPPVPFSPFESVDPASLRHHERILVRLIPNPYVGRVDVSPDFAIVRSRAMQFFLPSGAETLTDVWLLDPDLRDAVSLRFRNAPAPAANFRIRRHTEEPLEADVALSPFRPRHRPPATVRLTFREAAAPAAVQTFRFTRDLHLQARDREAWSRLPPAVRDRLQPLVAQHLAGHLESPPLDVEGTRYDVSINLREINWPFRPVRGHWFGIDSAGRDVLARILYGLRISMTFGFLLVFISMLLGIAVGSVQGYYGGAIDITGQRLIEVWSALPFLYVMILLGSTYGQSFALLLVCYAIFRWIGISYYMRAEFLRLRHLPFVDAARAMGIPAPRIIVRHILPNALTPVITFFPFSLVGAIGSLAALDYLGFGLPPPTPSWGELLRQAQQFRWAWWLILYPFLALFTVMLLGVFVGEGARDAMDPKPFSRME